MKHAPHVLSLVFLATLLAFAPRLSHGEPEDGPVDPFGTAWKEAYTPEDDAWKSVKQELVFNVGADPETVDPAKMTGVTEHTLALALYEGLVSHDPETLEPRPGVAERWSMSEDGKTYTFNLRKDAKWSNGDPVTAEDFRWSFFRCLVHPDCDYAYLFDHIVGAKDFRLNKVLEQKIYENYKKSVAIKTPDAHTLVVTLRAPTAYFLDLCAFETYMPVHRKTVEKHDKMWTRPENWVGNGPFVLSDVKPREYVLMKPCEHYWDRAFVKLTQIKALTIEDADTAYNKFKKSEVDWIRTVPLPKIDEAQETAEYFVQPYLGTYFYRINVTRPHLKDKRVRKALSLAVNRKTITSDVTRGGQIPANWFCPEVGGYKPAEGLKYDPDEARRLIKEAGYGPGGKPFPDLILLYNTQESHKMVAERIAQMWRETLGINVKLRNSEWKVYLNEVEKKNYDIARAGWIGDYGDPNTFMDMWLTDGGNNNTGWASSKYDDLIHKASFEIDPQKRFALFRQAEEILIRDEFPIIPIYIYVNQGMKRETLQGWYENIRDMHPFQYMYFEPAEDE